jgi:hypothetical protein
VLMLVRCGSSSCQRPKLTRGGGKTVAVNVGE